MELHEIVMKLIGPVTPVGETNEDERRLKNMKVLTELVDRLLFDIDLVAQFGSGRPEASMRYVGIHAKKFMDSVRCTEH